MKRQLSLPPTFILAAVLGFAAFASAQVGAPKPPDAPKDALPGHFAEARITTTAEVTAIDAPKRTIELREEGEEPQAYNVHEDVRNLDQVKVGDRVKADQYVSTSIRILKSGELGEKEVEKLDRSEPGEKPGGVAVRTRMRVERVSSIFPDAKEFLTRDDKGRLTTWKVKDAKDMETLKSGDRVLFTAVSALAVSVTPAPPSTAPTAAAAPAAEATPAAAAAPAAAPAEPAAATAAEPAKPAPAP